MMTTEEPPLDRFCDLVMKGGITSGVVYPKAIAMLAEQYRFKNIGGTSAGAIAAAVTAAAEYHRRRSGSRAGFDILAALPEQLGKSVARDRSRLLSLFQPQPATRRLFTVLIHALNSGGTYRRIAAIVAGVLIAYWPATLASVGVAWALYRLDGWLSALLVLFLLLPILVGAWIYVDVTRKLVLNNYGLCTGMTTAPSRHPALTPWLHDLLQRAAGRTVQDDPLTFGDLWDAAGFPPPWLNVSGPVRSIDLQLFSTNLSHGRPYILPLPEPDPGATRFHFRERLFFDPHELARYLPTDVLEWMCAKGTPYRVEPGRERHDPPTAAGKHLLEVPSAANFPVLFAARMSLSFPFLFSAVPLWAIDYDTPPPNDDAPEHQRQFRRCWFSDGGISSNFPMHLFDGLVPLWPTFGIDLEPKLNDRPEVFLPADYAQGFGERWNLFGDGQAPASRLGGFIVAIIGTMQNWNDNALVRMPGVRDRVARVRLADNEGGINLNMEPPLIKRIATRGELAAQELVDHFAERATGAQAQGWDDHRVVRLSVLLKSMVARMSGVANAVAPGRPHATDFNVLFNTMTSLTGPGYEQPLSPAEENVLRDDITALTNLSARLSAAFSFKAFPSPELRVRPPL